MNEFKEWLLEKGYAEKTVAQRIKDTSTYLIWLATRQKPITHTYPILMDYIGHLRKEGKSNTVVNHTLKAISQYLDYQDLDNAVRIIKIRTPPKSKPRLLTAQTMEQTYEHFTPTKTGNNEGYYYHSDKLILGLIIYQALDVRDIYRLETDHLDLEKGKIYIKGSAKGNSRRLPLKPQQILSLHHYTLQTRPTLLNKAASTNYQPIKDSDKLFIPQSEKLYRVIYQWRKLSVKVKEQTKDTAYEVIRLQQLRQSCIAHWIKAHGLRQAQYMAGFRTISGVERYQEAYLEDLQQQLELYHPLK